MGACRSSGGDPLDDAVDAPLAMVAPGGMPRCAVLPWSAAVGHDAHAETV